MFTRTPSSYIKVCQYLFNCVLLGKACDWKSVDSLPEHITEPKMTTINNQPFIFGGYNVR